MTWTRVFILYLSGSLAWAHTVGESQTAVAPASPSERLSYACAQNLASLVVGTHQQGPLFTEGPLVFTSLEAQDFSPLLLVNSGAGNFVIRLDGLGLKRLRFVLPESDGKDSHVFFLSYMHGGMIPARYFDYSEDHPPSGHDATDYQLVTAVRADNLLPHLNYAIQKTAQATLAALGEGRLTREAMSPHAVSFCKQLLYKSPALASGLKHNLDSLELMVMGESLPAPEHRMPASVQTPRVFLRPKTTSSLALRFSTEWRQRVQNKNSK